MNLRFNYKNSLYKLKFSIAIGNVAFIITRTLSSSNKESFNVLRSEELILNKTLFIKVVFVARCRTTTFGQQKKFVNFDYALIS